MAVAQKKNSTELDAFILFNESENKVEDIVSWLDLRGVSTYFWRRDIGAGEDWDATERKNLERARVVLVFLGERGWGPNHLRITKEAIAMEKRIIPILVGDPPKGGFEEAGGLFTKRRYLDFIQPNDEMYERLLGEIRREPEAPSDWPLGHNAALLRRIDKIIDELVGGDDDVRAGALDELKKWNRSDQASLGARLRREIQERFGPDRRYVKKDADPRSWFLIALIWSDVGHAESRQIILDRLSPKLETNSFVRFWVLATLYESRAILLPDALDIALKDSKAAEVQNLARAIRAPHDVELIGQFQKSLSSTDEWEAWIVLKPMRVVAIPELVDDVCGALTWTGPPKPNIPYNALYALAHPEMRSAASVGLRKRFGLERSVALIVGIAVDPRTTKALRKFAELLIAFEDPSVESALEGDWAPDLAKTARALLQLMKEQRKPAGKREVFVAGYASDSIDVLDDRLEIQEDVQTLTAVMLAKDVKPPLAIGLFGDWGTGKSYFMESMIDAVDKRIKKGPSEQFCTDVCQIRFNAWHYVDTNLWASLVSTILEKLAAYVSPEKPDEEKEAILLAELGTAQAIKKEAQHEKEGAQKLLTERQNELKDLQVEREQKEVTLRDLRAVDLAEILDSNPKLKNELETALDDVGVMAAISSVSDLANVLTEANTLRSRIVAFFVALFKGKNRNVTIVLLAALLILPFAVPPFLEWLGANATVSRLVALLAEVTAAVVGATKVVSVALTRVKGGFEKVEAAKRAIDKVIAEKRQNPTDEEKKVQAEIAELRTQEQAAETNLTAAAARVVELEGRIRAIQEGRSLARFLVERTNSDDYRKHLGLISTIRKDFESLVHRFSDQHKPAGPDTLRSVDRIILYIDDLDRCPADDVMEVLQAVHLLLAYPLFVVVVGVDPRWLLHSLETTSTVFQESSKNKSEVWRTTPQNYLEKIFQIPFNLNRMSETGYGNLLVGLMGSAAKSTGAQTDGSNHESRAVSELAPKGKQALADSTGGASAAPHTKPQSTQTGTATTTGSGSPAEKMKEDQAVKFEVRADALNIQSWEVAFAERLYALIPTPRAAKRFSNIYRILKARVGDHDLPTFEGNEEAPGLFQIPMLLLAMLIGASEESSLVFPVILEKCGAGENIADVLATLAHSDSTGKLATLHEKIIPICGDSNFPDSAAAYVEWIPRVARFSFDVGRALNAKGSRPAAQVAV